MATLADHQMIKHFDAMRLCRLDNGLVSRLRSVLSECGPTPFVFPTRLELFERLAH